MARRGGRIRLVRECPFGRQGAGGPPGGGERRRDAREPGQPLRDAARDPFPAEGVEVLAEEGHGALDAALMQGDVGEVVQPPRDIGQADCLQLVGHLRRLADRQGGSWFLALSGVPHARLVVLASAQHFAEKIHAYTFPWQGRPNTRVRDLVDLVLPIDTGALDPATTVAALRLTFAQRAIHPLPPALPPPPEAWARRSRR